MINYFFKSIISKALLFLSFIHFLLILVHCSFPILFLCRYPRGPYCEFRGNYFFSLSQSKCAHQKSNVSNDNSWKFSHKEMKFFSLLQFVYMFVLLFFKGTHHYSSYYVVVLSWSSLVMEKKNNVQPYKIAKPAGIQHKNILFCAQTWKAFSLHTSLFLSKMFYLTKQPTLSFLVFMSKLHFIFQSQNENRKCI